MIPVPSSIGDWLSLLEKIAIIIAATTIWFARQEYTYKKRQDHNYAAIDQISFFRKEIFPTQEKFNEKVRNNLGKNFAFPRIKLDDPAVGFFASSISSQVQHQKQLVAQADSFVVQTDLLNMLEELSLRIFHFQTQGHSALNSIKAPFVQLVEVNASVLLEQRDLLTGEPTYENILSLYRKWVVEVDRRSPEERFRSIHTKP